MSTTPAKIDKNVKAFAAQLSNETPVFIKVAVDVDAQQGECIHNCQARVHKDGGKILAGWLIWEDSGLFLMAEWHTVWQDPAGSLIDITPKADGERQIVFVPDTNAQWTGVAQYNKFYRVSKHPSVQTFIDAKVKFGNFAVGLRTLLAKTQEENPALNKPAAADLCITQAMKDRLAQLQFAADKAQVEMLRELRSRRG